MCDRRYVVNRARLNGSTPHVSWGSSGRPPTGPGGSTPHPSWGSTGRPVTGAGGSTPHPSWGSAGQPGVLPTRWGTGGSNPYNSWGGTAPTPASAGGSNPHHTWGGAPHAPRRPGWGASDGGSTPHASWGSAGGRRVAPAAAPHTGVAPSTAYQPAVAAYVPPLPVAEAIFCGECGTRLQPTFNVCPECGTPRPGRVPRRRGAPPLPPTTTPTSGTRSHGTASVGYRTVSDPGSGEDDQVDGDEDTEYESATESDSEDDGELMDARHPGVHRHLSTQTL